MQTLWTYACLNKLNPPVIPVAKTQGMQADYKVASDLNSTLSFPRSNKELPLLSSLNFSSC